MMASVTGEPKKAMNTCIRQRILEVIDSPSSTDNKALPKRLAGTSPFTALALFLLNSVSIVPGQIATRHPIS